MIDNRALTVLAVVTAEQLVDIGFDDMEKFVVVIEGALREAFKRGFNDCNEGKLSESEEQK